MSGRRRNGDARIGDSGGEGIRDKGDDEDSGEELGS